MRILFHWLLLLGLLAALPSARATVPLGMRSSGKQILLYWPAANSNCVLQCSYAVGSTQWTSVTDAVPVVYGSYIAVTVPQTPVTRFFRLYTPNVVAARLANQGVRPHLINNAATNGMAAIPGEYFTLGDVLDAAGDAAPVNVTVSAFYLDATPVTYAQWQTVSAWATGHGYQFAHPGAGKGTNHPVQTVDWFDCVKWCNARSQYLGLTPAYYTDASLTQVYTNGETANLKVNWWAQGYRLPTETEWEMAARGGLLGQRFPWGNIISQSLANYDGATNFFYDTGPGSYSLAFTNGGMPYTSPVGTFGANGFGLSDMAGNVNEWCWDWYGTPYSGGSDPRGPASGVWKVLRGGAWFSGPDTCRVANRNFDNPKDCYGGIGFRCLFPAVEAQNYSITWFEINGGETTSSGGAYSLTGTVGQTDEDGPLIAPGYYWLTGGF